MMKRCHSEFLIEEFRVSKMCYFTFVMKQEEQCEGGLSSTVLWERGAETPLRDPITTNSRMTRVILTYCFLTILTSCSQANLLTYKHRKYYKENSIISSDSTFKLNQNACYNRPGVIDEEFCYDLTLKFVDTSAAKTKTILDLQTDTLIVKAGYGIFSVWNWSDENNKVSGQIEILKWDKNEVILKENILAVDLRRKETKKFVGTRTFKRNDG